MPFCASTTSLGMDDLLLADQPLIASVKSFAPVGDDQRLLHDSMSYFELLIFLAWVLHLDIRGNFHTIDILLKEHAARR